MSNIFDSISSGDQPKPEVRPSREDGAHSDAMESAASASTEVPQTRAGVKQVTQELLRYGFIEEQRKAELFRRAATLHREIAVALEPLDFQMRLDEHRGIAYLAVDKTDAGGGGSNLDGLGETTGNAEGDEWSHPLVRRRRLTLEQSLLIAILRQAFVMHEQESGVGGPPAKVAVEDLLPQFLTYLEDSGSDAKNESRLASLLDQLKSHGIVSEIDKNDEVTIRPLIAHLANPESLAALLRTLEEAARPEGAGNNAVCEGSSATATE